MKRPLRIVGWAIVWLVLATYFTYLRFPYGRIRPMIEERIAAAGLGTARIDEIRASPWGGLRLEGVEWRLPSGRGAPTVKPVSIDSLEVSPALWKLVRGARGLRFSAKLSGGVIAGTAALTRDAQTQLQAKVEHIDLARAPGASELEGLQGMLSGKIDLALERIALDAGKGSVRLDAIDGAVPVMAPGGVKFISKPVRFQKASLDLVLDGPKADVPDLSMSGPDVEGSASGNVNLRPGALARSELKADVRFHIPEGSALKSAEGLLAGLKLKKDAEGYFTLKLAGTLSAPMPKL